MIPNTHMVLLPGNAVQTLTSSDKVKLITVRGTAFEAAATGGSAEVGQGEFSAHKGQQACYFSC